MSSIRFGFLRALAENGVSLEEFNSFLAKRANSIQLNKTAESILSGPLASTGSVLLQTALIPAAVSIGGGLLAGTGAAHVADKLLYDEPATNIEDLKNEELINEIKVRAALLKRKAAMKQLKAK